VTEAKLQITRPPGCHGSNIGSSSDYRMIYVPFGLGVKPSGLDISTWFSASSICRYTVRLEKA
jgi:hypothetical protein